MLPTHSASTTPIKRFVFLDALRGVAVLSVFLCHIAFLLPSSAPLYWVQEWVDLGQLGVLTFFLISGFVISISMEHMCLGHFWVRRVFRLYPMYWCSIAIVAILALSGVKIPSTLTFHQTSSLDLVSNLSMIQNLLGVPNLLGVYWTLFMEMLFYLCMTILFLLRRLHNTVPITVVLMILAIIIEGSRPWTGDEPTRTSMYLAVMLTGNMFYRYMYGQVTLRTLIVICSLCLAMFFCIPTTANILIARFVAISLFALVMILRPETRWLVYFGRISYSFYLLHVLIIELISTGNMWLDCILWLAMTTLVSHLSYRWVEQPAIALAKKWTAKAPSIEDRQQTNEVSSSQVPV